MSIIEIPLSAKDEYILNTFDKDRYLRGFNKGLRGISIPVGYFSGALHKNVLNDIDPRNASDVSHFANTFNFREGRLEATVLEVFWCTIKERYKARVKWNTEVEPPLELRITAILKGKRCVRVMQFGIE